MLIAAAVRRRRRKSLHAAIPIGKSLEELRRYPNQVDANFRRCDARHDIGNPRLPGHNGTLPGVSELPIAYAWVSTDEQDLTAQCDALAGLAVPKRIYVDAD